MHACSFYKTFFQQGPIVIDNLGGSFSGRVSLPGPTTKTIATGLSRAVSAPPVMRTSSHSRRRSGGGGGAGQMSPGLPTVGESLLSPVSDVSGSASVYMAEYEGGAGEAGAAGAAAMIVSDDGQFESRRGFFSDVLYFIPAEGILRIGRQLSAVRACASTIARAEVARANARYISRGRA